MSNDPDVAAAVAPASTHVLSPSHRHKRLLRAHFKQRATSSVVGGNQVLPSTKAGETLTTISPEKLAEISEVSGVRYELLCMPHPINFALFLASFHAFVIPAFLQVLATLRCHRLPANNT